MLRGEYAEARAALERARERRGGYAARIQEMQAEVDAAEAAARAAGAPAGP
jgi:hypothetical protein